MFVNEGDKRIRNPFVHFDKLNEQQKLPELVEGSSLFKSIFVIHR